MSLPMSDTAAPIAASRPVPPEIRVFSNIPEAEADWRAIEADGITTPYQSYDWVYALVEAGGEPKGTIAIAVVYEHGAAQLVMPLIVEQRFGAARGRLIGTHIANTDFLPTRTGFALTDERLAEIWSAVRKATGALDLVSFFNLPKAWHGSANPLITPDCDLSPNNLYITAIAPTEGPYIETHLHGKKRANIKRGARRLEETSGPVQLRRVTDFAELQKVHAEFLKQRGERFEQMGIANVFAEPWFQRFFKALATEGFGQSRPALCFHALYSGNEIVATCCGAFSGTHYSQYINSTASGPAAKFSLMGILVGELMDELTEAGITGFDMGTGDFDYKTDWTAPTELYNRLIAVSPRGRVAAFALGRREALKRLIKQNAKLWGLAKQVRLTLYKLMQRK